MTPQMTETNLKDIDTTEISNQLRSFSNLPLITRKCIVSLNSLVLLYTKEELSDKILNQYFTTILKSFHSKESYLKFMTHFTISKIGKDTSDSFLAISSLLKDINDKKFKESALKALFSVIPDQMLNDYKPVLVQGYVSRQEEAENISACIYYSLLKSNKAEKWIVNPSTDFSKIKMALNFEIKKNDKNYLAAMLNHNFKDSRSVFLVKVAFYLYLEDRKKDEFVKDFLNLKYNQEMVFVEACKQLIDLPDEDVVKYLSIALSSLKALLKYKKQIIRFTGIKLLNQLAKRFPQHCENLSEEVEELINDTNKNISVLATTTILLIGSEESASRLISKVSSIFSSLTEAYKTFLVEAVTKLLKKFKSKRNDFISFYKIALEEKGSFEFKLFLLKNIKEIIHTNREEFLKILSFYIEDSLNYKVTISVLNILSEEIPLIFSEEMSKNYLIDNFLVHIFNRLILENNHVRIAALECLTNISKYIEFLREDLRKLLVKFSKDYDLSETALFLLQTYEINGEKLSKQELKELNIKKEEKQGSFLIKECREIDLSERNADLKILLKKTIYSDFIDLSFKIENMLNGILIKEGIFSFAVFFTQREIKKEFQFEFENLKSNCVKEFNLSIKNDELLLMSNSLELDEIINVNSVIDYLLCPENDFTELEKESISCLPFQISFIDYFTPCFLQTDPLYSSSSSFILDCDETNLALQKILQIFNFQLVNQFEENNEIKCVLEGKYYDYEVRVIVEMWKKNGVNVNLDVFCNYEFGAERIIKLFE